jgi:LPXTG-motif cell wall-anchored protein
MTSRSTSRLGAALIGAIATLALTAGAAFAHPESEGEHNGCVVTAEPGTIPAGGQFTVAGNFGPASIFVMPGRNATPGEDEEPDATTTGTSFSVTFTASGSPGDLTVLAFIDATECGDTDHVTVTAATLPNTATKGQTDALAGGIGLLLLGAALLASRTRSVTRRV